MELTQARLKELFEYLPDTGEFVRLVTTGSRGRQGEIVRGCYDHKAHLVIRVDKRLYGAHRLAWLYMTGNWPSEVDHENQDGTDNRWANLRECSHASNMRNQKLRITNTSGTVGVSFDETRQRWVACISVNSKTKHLYQGPDFASACRARLAAEVQYGYHANHGKAHERL